MPLAATVRTLPQSHPRARTIVIVVAASLFVALAAQVSFPIPFSPVPFTLQDLAVLLVGIALGPWRGAAALALYLAEGAVGLPVFSPAAGISGIAHLVGPTGGYLLAYPLVAWVAGLSANLRTNPFVRTLVSSALAQVVLFTGGVCWLAVYTHNWTHAFAVGAVPFLPLAGVKVVIAGLIGSRLRK